MSQQILAPSSYHEGMCSWAIIMSVTLDITYLASFYPFTRFINRPATKKVLLLKYAKPGQLGDGSVSYNAVRAASILAGEIQPMPDLLAHLGCSKAILNR